MKSERENKLQEIRRLYDEKDLTIKQIAEKFGVSSQAIYCRLQRAGILLRPRSLKKNFNRQVLEKLYLIEKFTLKESAKRLKTTPRVLKRELKKNGIEIRPYGTTRRKYPEFYEIKVGETVLIKRPPVKNPVSLLHSKATMARMKITVRSLENCMMEIHRLK